jgi:tetratricopeptide (TPR) repeat protein
MPAMSRHHVIAGLLLGMVLLGCSPVATPPVVSPSPAEAEPKPTELSPAKRLVRGQARLRKAKYALAEADFSAALDSSQPDVAAFGLVQVWLATGRYQQAADSAAKIGQSDPNLRREAMWLRGEALRRLGKLGEAETALRTVEKDPAARRARLLLGEILLEQGKRDDAERPLLSIIEDYNEGRIAAEDGHTLALVGRAAHLLRSPHDANAAFDEAERVLEGDVQTLLWRAELFLEKYDPGHAEEVTQEALAQAPEHPEALVWMALVKLDQTYDFETAEKLARRALAVDPKLSSAHFVLAGIALRDMDLGLADQRLDAGLQYNPRQLDLLSLKAAVRFLSDDSAGFDQAKRKVLSLNPRYSRMYQIIGEFAEWEHRYDEIVEMMREAVILDSDDSKARATLGLNLIRAGEEHEGLAELRRAFDRDPFNVRVYNTLNLFKKVIPQNYVTVEHGPFRIRYHREERELLERYVPQMLDRAWAAMCRYYDFTPSTPVGIEIYAERQSFSIRTSGLPNTGIQGVCFGKTLAAVSPMHETFNLGMTLWHELAHVFHIQLSKNHVPRWFTEGLAEYETLVARPEWRREHDPDLYAALRDHRLPRVGAMNRAFTRAERMSDMATAYYASTQILVMLEHRYGRRALDQMLELWGQGMRTPEVVKTALGLSAAELDQQFRAYLQQQLKRYEGQFMPLDRADSLEQEQAAAKRAPRDPTAHVRVALAALQVGKVRLARKALTRALALDEDHPDALWLSAKLAQKTSSAASAEAASLLGRLVQKGHDGYAVQMALAELAAERRDLPATKAALQAAHRFDPTMSEPLRLLADIAAKQEAVDDEVEALRKLTAIEQHDPGPYRRLLKLLLGRGELEEAREVGEAAIYADVNGIRTHQLYADVLVASRRLPQAIYELESAIVCPGRPKELADAHAQLAETYLRVHRRAAAVKQARIARELDPANPRLTKLPP